MSINRRSHDNRAQRNLLVRDLSGLVDTETSFVRTKAELMDAERLDAERLLSDLLRWKYPTLTTKWTEVDTASRSDSRVKEPTSRRRLAFALEPAASNWLLADAPGVGQVRLFLSDGSIARSSSINATNRSNSSADSSAGRPVVFNILIGENALPPIFKKQRQDHEAAAKANGLTLCGGERLEMDLSVDSRDFLAVREQQMDGQGQFPEPHNPSDSNWFTFRNEMRTFSKKYFPVDTVRQTDRNLLL